MPQSLNYSGNYMEMFTPEFHEPHFEECVDCQGTGQVESTEEDDPIIPCDKCNGEGWIETE